MKKLVLLAVLAASLPAISHAESGAERQKSFKTVLRNFEPMGVLLRSGGFHKDVFAKHADAMKATAAAPFAQFKSNAIDDVSRAKPEIWTQPAKWKAEESKFLQAVDSLHKSAQTDDLAAIRRDYAAVSASCKSCHDSFRGPIR